MTSHGLTPLGLAVREGELDTIKYLITEYNVDMNGKLVILGYNYVNKSAEIKYVYNPVDGT